MVRRAEPVSILPRLHEDDIEFIDELRSSYVLRQWSLTFVNKDLEAAYLLHHMDHMRLTARTIYIPIALISGGMVLLVLTFAGPGVIGAVLHVFCGLSVSLLGVLSRRKYDRFCCMDADVAFQRLLLLAQVAFVCASVWMVWAPLLHKFSNKQQCQHPATQQVCSFVTQGLTPYPVLMLSAMAPLMHTVCFGIKWVPVMCVAVLSYAPAVTYLALFEQTEARWCILCFTGAWAVGVIICWVIVRQEREAFVWRRLALSEAKVKLERTFNAFICHEIRNPFAVIKVRWSAGRALLRCSGRG
jgi:hypothetical protein